VPNRIKVSKTVSDKTIFLFIFPPFLMLHVKVCEMQVDNQKMTTSSRYHSEFHLRIPTPHSPNTNYQLPNPQYQLPNT